MSYLYAAFAIVWVVLMAYIFNLIRMHKALSDEINVMKNLK
ncbi:MAG: CcmD family protein [Euryarchaeota archaeon]|nr:CcmD family protein [Euryarchaeota archaeon]MCG2735887.1 CcmD family protein [Candidatus Methanoperedenaceae archaeon]MDP3104491.1 CcmD family protein [Candidatus Methanoperedens sp.]MBU4220275.1 CcmD family protein [Euryarchaeota archaeon]MBU4339678.1 CcmD family protein [Euryarchaeota archaeon]